MVLRKQKKIHFKQKFVKGGGGYNGGFTKVWMDELYFVKITKPRYDKVLKFSCYTFSCIFNLWSYNDMKIKIRMGLRKHSVKSIYIKVRGLVTMTKIEKRNVSKELCVRRLCWIGVVIYSI